MSRDNTTASDDLLAMGARARAAAQATASSSGAARADAIRGMARAIRESTDDIVLANQQDLETARERQLSAAMIDRLMLDPGRIEAIAAALETIADLPDPLGVVQEQRTRPNGLHISRVSVPLGVIGIIYESRPNVTADAAAICLKAGNAVVLRGGTESTHSSRLIVACIRSALRTSGLPADLVQMLPSQDRALVGELLSGLGGQIDVVVPRGGRALIERVQQDARVPVIGHLEGLCHVYLHASAQADMAKDVVLNAKLRRTGICGAAETLLVDSALPEKTTHRVINALLDAGCEVRGCEQIQAVSSRVVAATESDWSTEYLDSIIAVKMVDDLSAAISHIRHYGSGHTESIIANDTAAANQFLTRLDSAIVMHNTSTQFADGGEFGMGAEIGISTSRIHARGPVGAAQLTSYKYVVRGDGQVRD
ncbi:MAG: glutamate-5-semialdehyde dehydrogenase [Pseudomonadota bacterium]